jgi:hypothetical protein
MTTVQLGDIEKEIWLASSWQVEQDQVDRIMARVNQYVAQRGDGGGVGVDFHNAEVAAALARGRDEGYGDGRRSLTVEDLPETEQQRLDDLRTSARQEGYTLGHNEGLSQGQATAKPSGPVFPSPAPTGALVQVDGAVWQLLGVPLVLGDAVAAKEPLPVRPVPPRAGARQVSVQGTSQLRPDQRKCRVCGEIKSLEGDFYRDAKGQQGRKTICKDCEVVTKADRAKRKALEAQAVPV